MRTVGSVPCLLFKAALQLKRVQIIIPMDNHATTADLTRVINEATQSIN